MKNLEETQDFPAAHSMDSGWFAVDEDGNLAHFDTGEAGALPQDVTFMTGEAGGYGDAPDLWSTLVLPWIARNVDPEKVARFGLLIALFETEETAAQAVDAGGQANAQNPLLVEVPYDDADPTKPARRFMQMEGFVGLAPDPYEARWDASELLPVVLYSHGDWDIPGHYVRSALPSRAMTLDDEWIDRFKTFPVRFAEAETVQLADFYTNDECDSWSQGDLRTGEIPERESLLSWFMQVLGLKK